jgi:tRNA pseudouridine38-40 synthase
MGKFYLGHVSYNGDAYYGWQKQKDVPTIQETIFDSLRRIYPLGRIDVKATSRTDRGVHAFAQVVKFLAPRRENPLDVLEKLQEELPADIQFTQMERINKSFKVTYLAQFKEYLYFFSPNRDVLPYDFVGHYQGTTDLDLDLMKKAAKSFEGLHDFTHFQHRSDARSDFKRLIMNADIVAADSLFPDMGFPPDTYCFYVRGGGFLKQMVRLMVGGLFLVGSGQITLLELEKALTGAELDPDKRVSFIAPPNGLFLYHIEFPEVMVSDIMRKVIDNRNFKNLFPNFDIWQSKDPQSFPVEVRDL